MNTTTTTRDQTDDMDEQCIRLSWYGYQHKRHTNENKHSRSNRQRE